MQPIHPQVTLRDHATLWVEITPRDGRVEQHSFHSYRMLRNRYQMLRMSETPEIEVHLGKSTEQPGAPTSQAGPQSSSQPPTSPLRHSESGSRSCWFEV
ncbi:MAG TPA: hypothetical protein VKB53_09680, partial [Gammaproteobacteria bacterium]|nr:hypothetical protein [Gammaproteobacteria bacterium]